MLRPIHRGSRLRLAPAWLLVLGLASPIAAQRPNLLSFEEGEEGWLLMFYGTSLDGWGVVGEGGWEVASGEIRASGGPGYLVSEEVYGDFEVKLDFLDGGSWRMKLWHDADDSGTNAEHLDVDERTVSAGDTITLKLAPAGGTVAHFERE